MALDAAKAFLAERLLSNGLLTPMTEFKGAVLRRDHDQGFCVLPKRWIVERTFGWMQWCRRLSKDYERLPHTSETFIYLAMIRIMLKRLA